MIRVGHPDNPLTQCRKLFPKLYMLSAHGSLTTMKRRIPALSAIELQFQLFKEVPGTAKPLKAYVRKARQLGLEFTAHAPFLFDKNKPGHRPIQFNADWVWPVVPASYADERAQGKHTMAARQGAFKEYRHLVEVLGELGIRVLTIHVTEHGVLMSSSEWKRYLTIMKKLDITARRVGVTLAIETGGMLPRHMQDVADAGLHMNFDIPHFFMEMLDQGKNTREADALAVNAFKRFQAHIAILHLSQPTTERDAHMRLLDRRGAVSCVDAILTQARRRGIPRFVILETQPDKRAIAHVHNILNR